VGEVVKVHTGFGFTEGPAPDAAGNLYFSDVRSNCIHQLDLAGKLSTFMEKTQGANGLMFDGKGRLIACQGQTGRVIAYEFATKRILVVADRFNNQRFNAPNDLVVDRQGGIYFTDPSFRPEGRPQDKEGVYYVALDRQVTRLIDNLTRPNGVILSPDEQTLYLLAASQDRLMAYPVEKPGQLGPGRKLGQVTHPGDGLTVDTKGNLYLTQPKISALQVITPEGNTLGIIPIPEPPANCAFGGNDMKTLYVTARTSLYALRMEATGHRFGVP
jgi:gluconolactonase